ncbi:KxYKxGKxW signal peptide domain-containing protein, partial [Lentilactobacillus buchneri]
MTKLNRTNSKVHYKMYKAGKHWLYASLLTVGLMAGGAFGASTVEADTSDNQAPAPTTTAATTQPSADTQTAAQTSSADSSTATTDNSQTPAQSQNTAATTTSDSNQASGATTTTPDANQTSGATTPATTADDQGTDQAPTADPATTETNNSTQTTGTDQESNQPATTTNTTNDPSTTGTDNDATTTDPSNQTSDQPDQNAADDQNKASDPTTTDDQNTATTENTDATADSAKTATTADPTASSATADQTASLAKTPIDTQSLADPNSSDFWEQVFQLATIIPQAIAGAVISAPAILGGGTISLYPINSSSEPIVIPGRVLQFLTGGLWSSPWDIWNALKDGLGLNSSSTTTTAPVTSPNQSETTNLATASVSGQPIDFGDTIGEFIDSMVATILGELQYPILSDVPGIILWVTPSTPNQPTEPNQPTQP